MKLPKHTFDLTKKQRILICGCIKGWSVDCKVCGGGYWTSGQLNTLYDIGEYGMHGCTPTADPTKE